MLATVNASATLGIDAYIVKVEVDISKGLPSFATVGLPEGAVRESKDRVEAAIKNTGFPCGTLAGLATDSQCVVTPGGKAVLRCQIKASTGP